MEPQIHEIRLAGPWELSNGDSGTWERQKLPYCSAGTEPREILRRRFHRPSGLLNSSRVLLTAEVSGCLSGVRMNSQPVHQTSAGPGTTKSGLFLFDVTDVLLDFNTVEIQLAADDAATVVHAVRLRIIEE